MMTIIALSIGFAICCFGLFLFGLHNYVKNQNKKLYRYSLSIMFLSIAWMALAVVTYLNYLQQIRL